jgi:hypothetical protein
MRIQFRILNIQTQIRMYLSLLKRIRSRIQSENILWVKHEAILAWVLQAYMFASPHKEQRLLLMNRTNRRPKKSTKNQTKTKGFASKLQLDEIWPSINTSPRNHRLPELRENQIIAMNENGKKLKNTVQAKIWNTGGQLEHLGLHSPQKFRCLHEN